MKKTKITTTIIVVLALTVLAGEAIGQPRGRGRRGQGWGVGPGWGRRMVPGYRDHIAHGARDRTKTSSPNKAEAGVDSISISRDYVVHIALWDRARIRTSRVGNEAPADLISIFRAEA